MTTRKLAALAHAKWHDLATPIDKCRRCKRILRREAHNQDSEPEAS